MKKSTKRNIGAGIVMAAVLVAGGSMLPPSASALTIDEIQTQIQQLLAKIADLQVQLNAAISAQTPPTEPSTHRICSVLNRNLSKGAQGDDVQSLQEFLSEEGYFSANATGYFGPMTAQAVARWQTSQGVSGVGTVGPITRERIKVWCGNPSPTCKPINYMAILCPDGSPSQPTHDVNGCIVGYECPVANFTPPSNCKAWNDGCNTCSRTSPDSPPMCTMRACLANTGGIWAGKGYCSVYFDSTNGNKAPTISGFSGPTTLAVNLSGTWTIAASDPENQSLSYHVTWGDEQNVPPSAMQGAISDVFVQTTTFTHAYANAGTYTVTIVVRDVSGKEAKTSTTVKVGSDVACTMEYAPVCGQPPEPACRHAVPACMMPTPGPQTYSNRCMLDAAGATFLYNGACQTSQPTPGTCGPQQHACACATGSYCLSIGAMCINPSSACPAGS